ncbi:insulinase family protein [Phenylobacterium sp.]|uniref:insulinase family protein n=1 Tax=Phenylobacterium sp. TaxID=1871053 RepID=UPI002F3E638A
MRLLWCAAWLAAALTAAGTAQGQTAPAVALGVLASAPPPPADPQVRNGRLPNGLRYSVQQNATPKGALSLRLGFDFGSYDETDDERGAAHFVQHMAFSATRSFPDNQLALTFAPLGVAFGRDRNASTGFGRTVYQIDLPTATAREADLALRWLRDVADGMEFGAPEVDHERASIQGETAAPASGFAQLRDRIEAFEDQGLRSAQRLPLGAPQSISALTPQKLKTFYDRWYRPEHAFLVIVGDLPVNALEKQVTAAFATFAPPGSVVARTAAAPFALRGPDAQVQTDARVAAVARICRLAVPEPQGNEVANLRSLLMRGLWQAALQERLDVYRSRRDTPYSEVSISDELRPDALKTCVAVTPLKGREAAAIAAVSGEIRRFGREGPSETELDIAVEQLRAAVRHGIDAPPRTSPGRADDLLDRALDGLPQLAPRGGLKALDSMMDDVGPDAVKAAFARDWSGSGPLVTGTAPKALAQADVMAAIAAEPAPLPQSAQSHGPLKRGPALTSAQAKDVAELVERGRAFVAKRKGDKALKAFADGLAIDPDNADILNARGNLYLAVDRADLAMADFDHALAVNPKDDIVLFNRGIASKQVGHNSEALRDFNKVLRLTPNDPATLAAKADTYRQLGDLLLARDLYDAAIAADPKSATAWQARGEVRGELGDAAGAQADQAQAQKLSPPRGRT